MIFFAGSLILLSMVQTFLIYDMSKDLQRLRNNLWNLQQDQVNQRSEIDGVHQHCALLTDQLHVHNRRIMVLKKMVFPAKLSKEQKEQIKLMGKDVRKFDQ